MSIFAKPKSTVESLFRIGPPDPTTSPATPGSNGKDVATSKHEVFYVRGRPFIVPTGERPAAVAAERSSQSPPCSSTPATQCVAH